MDYETMIAELDRVCAIPSERVSEYTFDDAYADISKAYEHLDGEKAWLAFIEENVSSDDEDFLGWTIIDAQRMVSYAKESVKLAIWKAYDAGRLF